MCACVGGAARSVRWQHHKHGQEAGEERRRDQPLPTLLARIITTMHAAHVLQHPMSSDGCWPDSFASTN